MSVMAGTVQDTSTYKYRKENSIFGSVARTFIEREFLNDIVYSRLNFVQAENLSTKS